MERKEFIKTCGFACLGGLFVSSVLEGCSSSRQIAGTIESSDLVVPEAAFVKGTNSFSSYIVVQHESLKYPICVYRFGNTEYSALLMRCTHQGAELQVFGDRLECPAHGSQFSNTGKVENGPADTNLRIFPVRVQNNRIYISLK
jgi:nitrite reductase/ring-hydroxylating ferredoxin subunit